MRYSKLWATGTSIIAAALLFAGCEGVTYEPEVDVASLKTVSEQDFFNALKSINIEEDETTTMKDTSFSFEGESEEYPIIFTIDVYSVSDNFFAYTHCADEKTAKDLFSYYYDQYDDVFESPDFSGIKSYNVGENTGYILIDGRRDNKEERSYLPYHDALFLKGDTVIVAVASDYQLDIEKEVDDFLDHLGYPHP
ncbi:MAG: hypothetical protein IJK83_07200 [Clostridiales bacterium]|nr:hypothetical protein [Clostridiales bacterium]